MARPSEDEIIARLFAPVAGEGGLGLRDDAACITPPTGAQLVLTCDALVAGVHFFPDDPPRCVARKALRVNLSDLAAKGAQPLGVLLSLALPVDWTAEWLEAFAAALGEDCKAMRAPLLGGDTVKTPGPLTISITALGSVPAGRMVRRDGARVGDRIYVTGSIGDAALGLLLRQDRSHINRLGLGPAATSVLMARYLVPLPRLGLAEVLRAYANAAMDVSDGLVGDLTKLLKVSGVGGHIEAARVPLSDAARQALEADGTLLTKILTGGDDYEVLCTVPASAVADFEAAAAETGIPVTPIGFIKEGEGLVVIDEGGAALRFEQGSFSHF